MYAAMNLAMNALVLAFAARRTARRLSLGRALAASALGTVYALAAWGLPPCVRSLYGVPLAGIVMAITAFGFSARAAMLVLIGGWMAAGVTDFLVCKGVPPLWALTLCACMLMLCGRIGVRGAYGTARIRYRGRVKTLPVLYDSGNLLRDPLSGLPVVVAPYAMMRDILPPLTTRDLSTLPKGFTLLRAGTAGGDKTFMCFRPDAFALREGAAWREKNAVVALSDMKTPYALAGDEMITKGRNEYAAFD